MTSRVPANAEMIGMFSDYVVEEKTPSAFALGKFFKREIGVECPSCERVTGIVEKHDHIYTCAGCDLKFTQVGSQMTIWR